MIALTTFCATLVFLSKAALAAFGAGLALLLFGTLVATILLSVASNVIDSLKYSYVKGEI